MSAALRHAKLLPSPAATGCPAAAAASRTAIRTDAPLWD